MGIIWLVPDDSFSVETPSNHALVLVSKDSKYASSSNCALHHPLRALRGGLLILAIIAWQ